MHTSTRLPRIGMICPRWLPSFGGAQQYTYAMTKALAARGFDVRVFAGTMAKEGRNNGDLAVTRFTPGGDQMRWCWDMVPRGESSRPLKGVFQQYAFMEAAIDWSVKNEIDVAVVGHPYQQTDLYHVRELYGGLQARGIKVGCLHFDLSTQLEEALRVNYLRMGNWEDAAGAVLANQQALLREHDRLQALYMMGSPLLFNPDFVVSCSDWSGRFIDPEGRVPKLTLHPLLDAAYWSAASPEPPLTRRDVLMVNPQGIKGPQQMLGLIARSESGWTFRIMQGGWGGALQKFTDQLRELDESVRHRIQFLPYVKDMRQAHAATRLVFFPSLREGYGMTAVEPMFSGVPVVSSNYPAVLEGVGTAALSRCPHKDAPEAWHAAVKEVLDNPAYWRERSLARARELEARQAVELERLGAFFAGVRPA